MAKKRNSVSISPSPDSAAASVISRISDTFSRGEMVLMSGAPISVEAVPTGSYALDYALGVGGLPKGRVIEIFGTTGGGKTTLCLSVIARYMASNPNVVAAYIDSENALDMAYCAKIGIDPGRMFIAQTNCGEECFTIAEKAINSGAGIVVFDSVASMQPRCMIDGEVGDITVGALARLMAKGIPRLLPLVQKRDCLIIFVNQLRQSIGVTFGNNETTPGGKALGYYASVRLDVRRIAGIKKNDEEIGNRVRVKVAKNKVAPPFRSAEFNVIFGVGIDWAADLFDTAVMRGHLETTGAGVYTLDNEKLQFRGRDSIITAIEQNIDDIADTLASKLYN